MMNEAYLKKRAEVGRKRRARTRAKILEAAFTLLGRENGRSTRIDDICSEADISRGTFYNHFSSIEEMFKALTFEISHSFNDATTAVLNRRPAGALRSATALRYYLHRTREDPAWGWAMVHLSAGGPIFGEETFRLATGSIEEGMLTEQFKISNAEAGRDVMMGATLSGMTTLLRFKMPDDYPEILVGQILRGLGVSESLIDKCVSAPLPDPFEFFAKHGAAPQDESYPDQLQMLVNQD